MVIIIGDEKNRALWKPGTVEKLLPGKVGVVRAVRLRAVKSCSERAVQYLYPLELQCGRRSFIYYVRKIFRKTNISYPLIYARTCAYMGLRILVFRKILLT